MRLGDRIIWQARGEPLALVLDELLSEAVGQRKCRRLVHIVNFYAVGATLDETQLATMRSLSASAQVVSEPKCVELVAVVTRSDRHIVEPMLVAGWRIVEMDEDDIGTPTLASILGAAQSVVEPEDTVVFSNADICTTLGFYEHVARLVEAGAESMIINRRTVHGFVPGEPLESLAAIARGTAHPGYDCFIFNGDLITTLDVGGACVGSAFVMLALVATLVPQSRTIVVLTDTHLTWHHGDDRPWRNDPEGANRNLMASEAVLGRLTQPERERLEVLYRSLPELDPRHHR